MAHRILSFMTSPLLKSLLATLFACQSSARVLVSARKVLLVDLIYPQSCPSIKLFELQDILPPAAGGMYNLFGFLMGPSPSGGADTVIAIKHTVYAVAWLAVNQSVCSTSHLKCQC